MTGKPNVLIFLTDDQRLNGGMEALPAVQKWFGEGGTTFTTPFATTPLCCPSRASLLTGEYAHNTKVISNNQDLPTLQAVQGLTIEHALQTAGYRTGIVGKYFNGWPDDQNPAYFNTWAITPHVTYHGAAWNVNGTVSTIDTYSTTFIQQQAEAFLNQGSRRRPWFLYVAPMAPHSPSTPEPRFARSTFPPMALDPSMTEQDRSDKPPFFNSEKLKTPARIQRRRLRMLRSLQSVNDLVSSVMTQLKAKGELNNTLAFFGSDNGYMWGEHGQFGKATPYLPSVQVPLLMTWPGHIRPGTVDNRIVALLDVAPTVFDAVGLKPPHPMDGIDLLKRDQSRTQILLEFWSYGGTSPPSWTAIYTKSYEYIEYTDFSANVIFKEYYDLTADPYQLDNLLGGTTATPPDVSALSVELATLRKCAGNTCPK